MKTRDVMNPTPVTVLVTARLRDAAILCSTTRASDLMVVDEHEAFVGVLSEGDIIRAALPNYGDLMEGDIPLHEVWKVFLEKSHELAVRPITPLIITAPIVLAPTDELLQAAAAMINRQIRILPVVEARRLVGTLSRGDLARAILTS